jgi:protein-tyrosine phosphatase
MAQALLRKALAENDIKDVKVYSAGTFAVYGEEALANGITAMKKKGINNSEHRSRRLSEQDLYNADYVFVMDEHNYEYIEVKYPQYLGKTYMLSQYAEIANTIPDPYCMEQSVYDSCADTLEQCIDVIVKKLKNR